MELLNHVPTGRHYHQYINPERDMPREAFEIHGLSNEFLRGHPKFAEVVNEFLTFIGDSKLVIHNAEFDMKFLNAELGWLHRPSLPMSRAVDTVGLARGKFPGSPASLDALCRRFGVDNSARTLHGALLDAEILAEVYLELIGGRQPDFVLSNDPRRPAGTSADVSWRPAPRPKLLPPRITDEEARAHSDFIKKLGSDALW